MDFNVYQDRALKYARYPRIGQNLNYPLKGIVGEVGEIYEKLKKIERDGGREVRCLTDLTETERLALKKELGDVLWYLSATSRELGYNFQEVADTNIQKLEDRLQRDQIHGSGDDR